MINLYQWASIQREINIKETYIMTTITNFLHSNFANSSQKQHKQDHEVPIWVVNGTRANNLLALKQYIIENCVASNKPLLHLDLSISVLKTVRNAYQRINITNGLELVAVFKEKPYYILTMSSQFRSNTQQFLSIVIKTLNNLQQQLKNFKSTEAAVSKGYSLIVEGLQIIGSEKKSLTSLQSFINRLSSLNQIYKQVSIFKHEGILSPDHQFSLERISTCVTDIEKYQPANGVWVVKSTVRRYTGHSNEQKYTISTQKNGKFKVEKWVPPKEESQTQTQRQMLNDLGFVVKKGQSIKDQGIKKMIYPHLRMQNANDCKCNKSECKKCEQPVKPQDEGLIILDDQQQDDDDIDV